MKKLTAGLSNFSEKQTINFLEENSPEMVNNWRNKIWRYAVN